MIKKLTLISTVVLTGLLTGCQSVNDDLGQINSGLSQLTGDNTASIATPNKRQIKNAWNVSNSTALAWLSHNELSWNDNGKLKNVNWYEFWSQQIHAGTELAKQGFNYCHGNKAGSNCQIYFQAYSMTNTEESQSWGKKTEDAA